MIISLILQYDNIILNSGCKYYIVLGDTDDPADSVDVNQESMEKTVIMWESVIHHGKQR